MRIECSHVDGHVGCFHLLTVANSPVVIAGYLLAHWCPSFFWVHPREWDCWVTSAAAAFNQRLCLSSRRLQEEDQQFRTSSLPAIPNPFPELCGPKSPPVPPPGSLPPSQAVAKQVSMPQWERRLLGCGVRVDMPAHYFGKKGG